MASDDEASDDDEASEDKEMEEDGGEKEEDEEDRTIYAPELQVLTPGYMIGYLNAMTTLIQTGVSGSHCGNGFEGIGVNTFRYARGDAYKICPKGFFGWQGGSSDAETLDALDILLTGGRLSP